jgi:hypothetical protein
VTTQRVESVSAQELWRRIEAAGPAAPGDELSDPNFFEDAERAYAQTDRRRSFIARYAWAVPTKEAVEAIAAFAHGLQVLEVCAGSGLWARLLTDAGLHVTATDAAPPPVAFFPVLQEAAPAAVQARPHSKALMLCWPPFRNNCAFRSLAKFEGELVIFAGDARFTADAQFHELLRMEWTLNQTIAIPSWPGLDDFVYLYHRSGAGGAKPLD